MAHEHLGYLLWFSIPKRITTSIDTLEQWCSELGIDPGTLPVRWPIDVFKKTIGGWQYEYPARWMGERMRARLLPHLDEITPDIARYRIVRYVRPLGTARRSVREDHVATVELHRKQRSRAESANRVRAWSFHGVTTEVERREWIDPELERLTRRYHEFQGLFDSDMVRSLLRRQLSGLDGLRVKDGVYFLPRMVETRVHLLQRLVSDLGAHFHYTVLYDCEQNRETITNYLTEVMLEKLEHLADEVGAARVVRPALFDRWRREYRTHLGVCTRYGQVVDVPEQVFDLLGDVLELLETARARVRPGKESGHESGAAERYGPPEELV